MKRIVAFLLGMLPAAAMAQQDVFYYHTIHTSSLAAMYGRRYKVNYTYQLSHNRQLKLSGQYIFDDYTENNDHVESDLYNVNVQFQYQLMHAQRIFFGLNVGVGGYVLNAVDEIGIKQRERTLNFAGGLQGEYYLTRNRLALLVDYDILYLPFSDVYQFLHIPMLGLGVFF